MNTVYVTTSIPYVNAAPHVGFALEAVLADAVARWHAQRGADVRFQSGTDENSLKCVRAAEEAGVSVQDLVAGHARAFEALTRCLDLRVDGFLRTSSDPRHRAGVEKLWRACAARGDLYRRRYEGLYCVGCEGFLKAAELTAGCCPIHGLPPEPVEEENWFFRLSRYQQELEDGLESGRLRILPESRRNELLAFVRRGLEDFSVSRSRERARGWGIPVPDDPDQVTYVWFDALGNYLTGLDYADEGDAFRRYWRESGERIHVIGKDITRFHAIYWPAILSAAGEPWPTTLLVHGFLTVDGRKIGKSAGNAIDPFGLVEEIGTDALRYALLRQVRSGEDGDFAPERARQARHAELAGQLGNLVHRVVALVVREAEGRVPLVGLLEATERTLVEAGRSLSAEVAARVEAFELHEALAAVWNFVALVNRTVEETAPWRLAGSRNPADRRRLHTVLFVLLDALRIVADALAPFLPGTAAEIERRIGGAVAGAPVRRGPPVFPRLDA